VEISSAPGLATRGASLFAPANGKGFTRAIPISRRLPDVLRDRDGANKVFSISTIEDDRAGARKRGDALERRSPTRGRFAVNELARLRRGRVSSRSAKRPFAFLSLFLSLARSPPDQIPKSGTLFSRRGDSFNFRFARCPVSRKPVISEYHRRYRRIATVTRQKEKSVKGVCVSNRNDADDFCPIREKAEKRARSRVLEPAKAAARRTLVCANAHAFKTSEAPNLIWNR